MSFVLRHSQLTAVKLMRHDRFLAWATDFLSTRYGKHLSRQELNALGSFVNRVEAKCAYWGFRTESEIVEVAMLMLEMRIAKKATFMPDWFQSIVGDESLGSTAKLYQLVRTWHSVLAADVVSRATDSS